MCTEKSSVMRSCICPRTWISPRGRRQRRLSLLPLDGATDRPTARLTNAMAQEGDVKAQIEELKSEIETLHDALQSMGKNSHGVKDIFGRRFPVPVDSEHKAT